MSRVKQLSQLSAVALTASVFSLATMNSVQAGTLINLDDEESLQLSNTPFGTHQHLDLKLGFDVNSGFDGAINPEGVLLSKPISRNINVVSFFEADDIENRLDAAEASAVRDSFVATDSFDSSYLVSYLKDVSAVSRDIATFRTTSWTVGDYQNQEATQKRKTEFLALPISYRQSDGLVGESHQQSFQEKIMAWAFERYLLDRQDVSFHFESQRTSQHVWRFEIISTHNDWTFDVSSKLPWLRTSLITARQKLNKSDPL